MITHYDQWIYLTRNNYFLFSIHQEHKERIEEAEEKERLQKEKEENERRQAEDAEEKEFAAGEKGEDIESGKNDIHDEIGIVDQPPQVLLVEIFLCFFVGTNRKLAFGAEEKCIWWILCIYIWTYKCKWYDC